MTLKLLSVLTLIGFISNFNAHAINLQKFHFSNSAGFTTLEDGLLNDGYITTDYKYIFVGSYNYVRAPFIEIDGNKRSKTIVEWMHTLNFGGAYRYSEKLQIGLSSFATYQDSEAVGSSEYEKNLSLGDTTLDLKYKFYEKNRMAISFTPKIYLATGNEDVYLSNGEAGYYLGFAIDKMFKYFQAVVNLGHKENPGAKLGDVDHRGQFHFSAGAIIPFIAKFDLTLEFFRDTPYDSNNEQIPSEGSFGIRYNQSNETAIFAGVGTGSLEETESTDMRMFLGLKFFPRAKQESKKIAKEESDFGKFYKLHNIFFKTASSKIDQTASLYMKDIITHLKQDPYISKIIVEGFASSMGNTQRNSKLSVARSQETKEFLVKNGIAPQIIEIVGYGDRFADKNILDKDSDRKVMLRVYRTR